MILILLVIIGGLFASQAYCQDIISEAAKNYTGIGASGNSLMAGFSFGGLIGGFLFGSIGFVAFIYGKRNVEFRPMIIGILLMTYPYFIRNTIAVYLVGIALIAVLFIFRE